MKPVPSVNQTNINVALLAIYLTVSCFTKTTVQIFFTKLGQMMNTIIQNVTYEYKY